ncbi:MAG: hypothetical protein OXH39_05570 [Candidatus Poribacteria bacterium]|nr:hypothetical protein [Candidatus Poribacteria bacterium]
MLSSRKPVYLMFGVCFGLAVFLIVSFHTPPSPPQPRPQRPVTSESTRFALERTQPRRKTESVRFEDTDFYRTIIDNNLFRPLGWTPPRPVSPYRLLGTLVSGATDGVWVSKAIIAVRGEMRVVEIGDSLNAETKVLGIDRHSVLLETSGKEQVLTLPVESVLLRGR